jgi:hypothetical protein
MPPEKTAESPALAVLKSIDQSLRTLVVLAQQKAEARVTRAAAAAPARAPLVASDRDLDGDYGDPEMTFTPRDWTGEPCKGKHLSECESELLDIIADTFEEFANKDEFEGRVTGTGKPTAPYKRRDAARARGWAARIRAGTHTPKKQEVPAFAGDDDVPF